jgi:hypothetical protein
MQDWGSRPSLGYDWYRAVRFLAVLAIGAADPGMRQVKSVPKFERKS